MSTATQTKAASVRIPRGHVHTLSDDKGPMRMRQFKLNPKVASSWCWDDAPANLKELCLHGKTDFVSVVPAKMRFSHLPPLTREVVELADGYVCFE